MMSPFKQARVEANASIVALLMLRKSLVSLLMPLLVDLIFPFKVVQRGVRSAPSI